jgi:hypothetical protein
MFGLAALIVPPLMVVDFFHYIIIDPGLKTRKTIIQHSIKNKLIFTKIPIIMDG